MDLAPGDKPIAIAMGAKRGGKDAPKHPPAPAQARSAAYWAIWVHFTRSTAMGTFTPCSNFDKVIDGSASSPVAVK
ncbi:hypothetical protein GALL_444320 [mine drainage metagenome]|uniref:Uncharacterized protein n=1 Tax=mine drainage metagenome TaxID=410659 RepID=A0A1J5PQQ5_9ZZZZ